MRLCCATPFTLYACLVAPTCGVGSPEQGSQKSLWNHRKCFTSMIAFMNYLSHNLLNIYRDCLILGTDLNMYCEEYRNHLEFI